MICDKKGNFCSSFNEATSLPGPLSKDDLLYSVHRMHRVRILISASLILYLEVHISATVAENLDHEPCSPCEFMADPKFARETGAPVRRKKIRKLDPFWARAGGLVPPP